MNMIFKDCCWVLKNELATRHVIDYVLNKNERYDNN
jgi:hypothetical protein